LRKGGLRIGKVASSGRGFDRPSVVIEQPQMEDKENPKSGRKSKFVREQKSELVDPDALGEELLGAANEGDAKRVKKLLVRGADPNFVSKKGAYTALIKAARMQRQECVQVLLANKADPNKASNNGWTALIEACRVGNKDLSTLLLNVPGIQFNYQNKMGWTCLVEAVRNGHLHIIKLLADYEIDFNNIDKDGFSPREHTTSPAIRELLETIWQQKCEAKNIDFSKVKADLKAKQEAIEARIEDKLVSAVDNGDIKLVEELLDKGVNINCASTNGGYSPLTMACRTDKPEIVRLLLKRGADIRHKARCGWTPMIEACRVGTMRVMKILHEWDKSPDVLELEQDFGWTAIIEACRNAHYRVVEQLVTWGADAAHVDYDGDVPIDHASDPWIMSLLRDRMKYRGKGARQNILNAYEQAEGKPPAEKQRIVMAAIRHEEEELARGGDMVPPADELHYTILTVILQKMDASVLPIVIKEIPGYSSLIASKPEILRDICQMELPDLESTKDMPPYLESVERLITTIVRSLFNELSEKERVIRKVEYVNEMKGTPAVLYVAEKFCSVVLKAASNKVQATRMAQRGLPWQARWYHHLIMTLLRIGCRLDSIDNNGNTVFTFMLKPTEKLGNCRKALEELISFYTAIWSKYERQVTKIMVNSAPTGQLTALSMLVLTTGINIEDLVLKHMDKGATGAGTGLAASKLTVRLLLMVKDTTLAWRVGVALVRNNDVNLFKDLVSKGLPVFMTDPESRPEKREFKWRLPEGGCKTDECLLHLAIANQSREMFETLLEYSVMPTRAFIDDDGPNAGTYYYPWPDAVVKTENKEEDQSDTPQRSRTPSFSLPSDGSDSTSKINWAVAWRNSYGQNSFHIIANQRSSSPTLADFFRILLAQDGQAMVSRVDNYGWAPVHYAALNNKLDIIQLLINNHNDLHQPTDGGPKDKGRTALHIAAMAGNWATVLQILKRTDDIEVVEAIDRDGCSALALAMLERQNIQQRRPREETVTEGKVGQSAEAAAEEEKKTVNVLEEVRVEDAVAEVSARQDESEGEEDEEGEAIKLRETYDMTIQALLNHGASIGKAASQSGKSYEQLMNVNERWHSFVRTITGMEADDVKIDRDYLDYVRPRLPNEPPRRRIPMPCNMCQEKARIQLREKDEKEAAESGEPVPQRTIKDVLLAASKICCDVLGEAPDFNHRRNRKVALERQHQVLATRKAELFSDKETQIVIQENYDSRVRTKLYVVMARYVVFLTALTALAVEQGTRDKMSAYFLQNGVENTLLNGDASDATKFANVVDPDSFYSWLKSGFGPQVYAAPNTFWDGTTQRNETIALLMGQNKFLGVPRLRQVRSQVLPCKVSNALKKRTNICFSTAEDGEMTDTYGPTGLSGSVSSAFVWAPQGVAKAVRVWGRSLQYYPGSGYVYNFPSLRDVSNLATLQADVDALAGAGWLDAATRAVFVEFTLFNANENHFLVASLVVEFPTGGGSLTSWDLSITRLSRSVTGKDPLISALEIIVLISALLHFRSEIIQLYRQWGWQYISSPYNFADALIISLVIALFALRMAEFDYAAVKFGVYDSYVPTLELSRIQYTQNILYAILVLVGWFKMFDYLSVFNNLYRLIIMIEMMAAQLVHWFIVFMVVLGAFTSSEYVAYGYLDPVSYTWVWGLIARFIGVFTGNAVVFSHTDQHRILGTFYDFLFIIATTMLLLNLIIALLTSAYSEALNQSGDTLAERQYETIKLSLGNIETEEEARAQKQKEDENERRFGIFGKCCSRVQNATDLVTKADYDAMAADTVSSVLLRWRDGYERSRAIAKVKQMELDRAIQLRKLQEVAGSSP